MQVHVQLCVRYFNCFTKYSCSNYYILLFTKEQCITLCCKQTFICNNKFNNNAFYRGTIESILSSCITVWGSSCTEHSRKALQRIVNTAGKIIGAPLPLPSLQDIYTTRL